MDIVVRGRNVRVPRHVSNAAREKLSKVARFTHDASRAEVDFSEIHAGRGSSSYRCEVTVHLKRHIVRAHASARDFDAALDLVIDKVEHQAARIKEKRVSRSHPRRRRNHVAPPEPDGAGDEEDVARIVKTKRFAAKPMNPEEAALQMELLGHDFFLFTNAENGQAAVIYRRADGDLGLIETSG